MSSWPVGRETIIELLEKGHLERVVPNSDFAYRLVAEAHAHMKSVEKIIGFDYSGAYQLGYDAVRKACTALLAQQGLRPTTTGGHIAVVVAIRAQFNGQYGSPAFSKVDSLRRGRADSQYPQSTTPSVSKDDATYCRETAQEIIVAVDKVFASDKLESFIR